MIAPSNAAVDLCPEHFWMIPTAVKVKLSWHLPDTTLCLRRELNSRTQDRPWFSSRWMEHNNGIVLLWSFDTSKKGKGEEAEMHWYWT